MVPLYATDWQFAPVYVPELITGSDSLIGPAGSVFSVPFLSQVLIGRHIIHDLKVHLSCETP